MPAFKKRSSLHRVLSGRRLTHLEFEHELPKLQDQLLDAQFELRQKKDRAVVLIVTGIPAAGRSRCRGRRRPARCPGS